MARSSNFTTPSKYVHEAIWLPTYAVVVLVILGTVQNGGAATLTVIVGLVACRMFLELLYRFAFGRFVLACLLWCPSLLCWLGYWVGIFSVHKTYDT